MNQLEQPTWQEVDGDIVTVDEYAPAVNQVFKNRHEMSLDPEFEKREVPNPAAPLPNQELWHIDLNADNVIALEGIRKMKEAARAARRSS